MMEKQQKTSTKSTLAICSYLLAIVVANLVVTLFGKAGLILTAVVLIPFDLFARDILHTTWYDHNLKARMAGLILAGSAISFALNRATIKVAIASCVSFALAAGIDFEAFQVLYSKGTRVRMHGSNIFSSLADSAAFVTLVFGFSLGTILAQWALKFAGSAAWTELYVRRGK
jgi:queuosine precursor transporter